MKDFFGWYGIRIHQAKSGVNNFGFLMIVPVNNEINKVYNETESNLNKIIYEMSSLLMLSQIVEAKELCSKTIKELKKSREFDSDVVTELNRMS